MAAPAAGADPPIRAAWDNQDEYGDNNSNDGMDDYKHQFMSKIDNEIDFDSRYEVVGCIELSATSSKYAKFKFVYFFLALAEQFGLYWITAYGTVRYGYAEWLERYIISLAIAGLISSVMSSVIGRLSDRFGRKYIIMLSIIIQSLPYISLIIFPSKMEYYLYALPIIGFCGSISTLTGVMKSYVVDCLPHNYLISAFAKLISIYGGAGILATMMIYTIIGNNIRDFFFENDLFELTTEIIMGTCIGLYIFAASLILCAVPESVTSEMKSKYSNINPCHGLTYALNAVVIYTAIFIFCCAFAQIGMMAVIQEIFLIDFNWTNYAPIDLVAVNEGTDSDNTVGYTDCDIDCLGDPLLVYGAFLFTLGCTLLCAPCCIKCCCGKAVTNMICSMILMIISFGMIIFLLFSNEWYTFVIALVSGILFAMGEIGFAFLDGSIAKFINSKQYGIAYGLLHSIYSLAKAIAPYTFFILFEIFTRSNTPNEVILGKAKSVVYIAIILALIGTLIGLLAVKTSMKKYKELHANNNGANEHVDLQQSYRPGEDNFDQVQQGIGSSSRHKSEPYANEDLRISPRARDRAPSAPREEDIEMQPPPQRPDYPESVASGVSSQWQVGQQAHGYVAPMGNHIPQYTVMQQQQINNMNNPGSQVQIQVLHNNPSNGPQVGSGGNYYPQSQVLHRPNYGNLPSQSHSGHNAVGPYVHQSPSPHNYGQPQIPQVFGGSNPPSQQYGSPSIHNQQQVVISPNNHYAGSNHYQY